MIILAGILHRFMAFPTRTKVLLGACAAGIALLFVMVWIKSRY